MLVDMPYIVPGIDPQYICSRVGIHPPSASLPYPPIRVWCKLSHAQIHSTGMLVIQWLYPPGIKHGVLENTL